MTEKTATELMEAMETGFRAFADATGGNMTREKFIELIKAGAIAAAALDPRSSAVVSKRGLKGYLLTQPEPRSLEEKERYKKFLVSLPLLLRKPFIKMARQLPYERKGQAPAFGGDPAIEKDAIERVGSLLACYELPEAIETVARKFEVSSKTMRRAWNRSRPKIEHGEI